MSTGRAIEKRIRLITSQEGLPMTPQWTRPFLLLGAVVVLPLGFAQSPQVVDELDDVRVWLDSGVSSGVITNAQAEVMLGALRGARQGELSAQELADRKAWGSRIVNDPPKGIMITSIELDDDGILEIVGQAESNARIADLMWLITNEIGREVDLNYIVVTPGPTGENVRRFGLLMR